MGRFFGLSPISAGFIAVLVGYTSSAAIVFQAASAAGASPAAPAADSYLDRLKKGGTQ